MNKQYVLACPITRVVRLLVDRNVWSVQSARWTGLVSVKNVETPAQVLAVWIPNATLSITALYAAAITVLPAIHLLDAILFHVRQQHLFFATTLATTNIILAPEPEQPAVAKNPCVPSPCGANAICQDINGIPSCSCMVGYIGSPPFCRPECTISAECPSNLACIAEKCRDPCPGSCGTNAQCTVQNHVPICICAEGFTGDPFTACYLKPLPRMTYIFDFNFFGNWTFLAPEPPKRDPCNPSPCGANAKCNDGICSCIEEYQGDPYRGCRPECVLNNDCPRDKTCSRNKCIDPCPGTCGQNAECTVINHIPSCTCIEGFVGNAFILCSPLPSKIVNKFDNSEKTKMSF